MPILLKNIRKKKWYQYIKYSKLFALYERIRKPQVREAHEREVQFYQSFLPHCHLVFDIGAYDGHKTEAFLAFADKVVCCEPDAFNYSTLNIRFRRRRNTVFIENKAVSNAIGEASYYIHHAGSAFNTLNTKWKHILEADKANRWDEQITFSGTATVSLTTLDQLIAQYGKPDFIKIDVEGYEQFVLQGLSTPIPHISFETLLPDCKQELLTCINHLMHLNRNTRFNVAYEEQLQMKTFVSYEEILHWMEQARPACYEIVARS
jgi:FkbM family methyltransferase